MNNNNCHPHLIHVDRLLLCASLCLVGLKFLHLSAFFLCNVSRKNKVFLFLNLLFLIKPISTLDSFPYTISYLNFQRLLAQYYPIANV